MRTYYIAGLLTSAFQYVVKNGLCLESAYPYKARDGTCKKCKTVAHISGYKEVPSNDLDALLDVLTRQPVSIALCVSSQFQFYSSGILKASQCCTNLDHGVQLVGAGAENGVDYWLVRNSWAASWGDQGYLKLERTSGKGSGTCGIALDASYPIV